jgi:hypothetical protein
MERRGTRPVINGVDLGAVFQEEFNGGWAAKPDSAVEGRDAILAFVDLGAMTYYTPHRAE